LKEQAVIFAILKGRARRWEMARDPSQMYFSFVRY